jgi:S-DNA-T family DNA segregation ATPase FtsK/SpoIIIE
MERKNFVSPFLMNGTRKMNATDLKEVLAHYGIKGEFQGENTGPLVTQLVFLPEAGTKLKNVSAVLPDIAREIGVTSLRVEPLAESRCLGFEFPNKECQTIDFMSLLSSEAFLNAKGSLPICLGVDVIGRPVVADLAKMPHLLVAGTTGSGKSVGLNTFILSLMAKHQPSELKFVLIDPKRVEFSGYNNQKYMLFPVVTDNALAMTALERLVEEMERRYGLFEDAMVRNIGEYNLTENNKLPFIVCVIDEFADLIAAEKKTADLVQRLAQKARAAGIHLIMATQRPSVDVVTGVLKANFPTRLAYKVASGADSRTILDCFGAEELIGRGDALFLGADGSLQRVHGAYVTDAQIAELLKPYRATVAPLVVDKPKAELPVKQAQKHIAKEDKGAFRCVFEFWCSLKQREKKTIIQGIKTFLQFAWKFLMSNKR